jgi:hypothetical protein
MAKGIRSNVDFTDHIIYPIVKSDELLLTFKFAKPNTNHYSITFINTCGIMAVTGDCGNWIFCRSFIPALANAVSDSYWCEKIRIASTQVPTAYSEDDTIEEIKEMLVDEENQLDEEDTKYLNNLLDHTGDGEMRYLCYAHDNLPHYRDSEFVPYRTRLDPMLSVVFDAFDEVCRRLKDGEYGSM